MSDEISTEESTNPAIKHGQGLLQRVEQRKQELAGRLAKIKAMPADQREHSGANAIEEALSAVAGLLTGDLNKIGEPTATQLNQWLETSQNLCDDQETAGAKVEAKAVEAKKAAEVKAEARATEAKAAEARAADAKATEAKAAETAA